jgi:hypothetical protein
MTNSSDRRDLPATPAAPAAAPAVKPDARSWLAAFAASLGVEPPTEAQLTELLALAGTAAHASERIAAPVACWLTAAAGVTPEVAHQLAREVAL